MLRSQGALSSAIIYCRGRLVAMQVHSKILTGEAQVQRGPSGIGEPHARTNCNLVAPINTLTLNGNYYAAFAAALYAAYRAPWLQYLHCRQDML